jgi:ParB-like chromosome segregation protein Spo0J
MGKPAEAPEPPAAPPMVIIMRAIGELQPFAGNARIHSDDQVQQIARSIEAYGFTLPVLIDEIGGIIAGHGRVLAAKRLGMTEVPCVVAIGWDDTKRRAYILADNKLAENSSWDKALLGSELATLEELGFDMALTGFSTDELDKLLGVDDLVVAELAVGDIHDRFWISIRGPLADQARALQILTTALAELPAVDIELGTIGLEA